MVYRLDVASGPAGRLPVQQLGNLSGRHSSIGDCLGVRGRTELVWPGHGKQFQGVVPRSDNIGESFRGVIGGQRARPIIDGTGAQGASKLAQYSCLPGQKLRSLCLQRRQPVDGRRQPGNGHGECYRQAIEGNSLLQRSTLLNVPAREAVPRAPLIVT